MKTPRSQLLEKYQFENVKSFPKAVIIGNALLFLIFLLSNGGQVFAHPFALACLISAVFILLVQMVYDWKDPQINLAILLLYLAIYLCEVILFGIPAPLISFSDFVSKGIFIELLAAVTPYVYTGIRAFLVIPLLLVYRITRKLTLA